MPQRHRTLGSHFPRRTTIRFAGKCARADGFTLIEVLVAFTIAAILLLPLLRGFASGVTSADQTDAFTQATVIAESAMESVGPALPLVDGSSQERQEGRYRVSTSVHLYQGEGAPTNPSPAVVPFEVVVAVNWQDAARTRSISLRSLRLGAPAAPEPSP
jgi:general secretion pathway protein I